MVNILSTVTLIVTVILYLCVGIILCMKGVSRITALSKPENPLVNAVASNVKNAFILIGIAFVLFIVTLCLPGLLINLMNITPAEFTKLDLTVIRIIRLIAVVLEISGLALLLNAFKPETK
ncbi:MAG: hypothetical protein AB1765_04205 [Candidatus Hydrogenedentota bacterium]